MNESAAPHPNQFLADLTQAMRLTAEAAQQEALDQCRADAKAYAEQLHARTDDEATGLRKTTEADVATIREQSKAQMDRIRLVTEQRIGRSRELLDKELLEFNSAIELEVENVQERVAAFENELAQFFDRLLEGADPATFASMASQIPDSPDFLERDREVLANNLRAKREGADGAATGEAQPGAESNVKKAEELPDHWWLDSPAALAVQIHGDGDVKTVV